MANWTYGGVRIFVESWEDSDAAIRARLDPLGGGTIIHDFGYEDTITRINCKIVGTTDRDAIRAMKTTTTFYTLTSPYGTLGTFKLKNATFKLTNSICQTLRPDLAESAPVFDVSLETYMYYA